MLLNYFTHVCRFVDGTADVDNGFGIGRDCCYSKKNMVEQIGRLDIEQNTF